MEVTSWEFRGKTHLAVRTALIHHPQQAYLLALNSECLTNLFLEGILLLFVKERERKREGERD